MDNISINDKATAEAGIPFDNIKWYDIAGQPFGAAAGFNVIVFKDANNIIDVEGPVAIGGSFYSTRGLSVGFAGREEKAVRYSPNLVRFLAGSNVSMTGPLVVVGHVVAGGGFRADRGSTYLIGKSDKGNQMQELKFLYQANGGSQYWTPSDKGDHYVIPSYDVPRYIPASRINADITGFFNDAGKSIENYKDCIESLMPNGTVVDNNYEWILRGNDPVQNVFLINAGPNGLINKGIRAEVPAGSTVIVRLRTGVNAHLQYGVYGERDKTNRTLYVFEDATNIYMEKSSDIWGSILAPQAMFHAHPTGGHVSGNAALGAFAVSAASGFEFHYFPFAGGVVCRAAAPAPAPATPVPVVPPPVIPMPVTPTPVLPPPVAPAQEAPQVCPVCPTPEPCPACPVQQPCPTPEPCPACPVPLPCPIPEPCPACPVPLPCPIPEPCPACPVCPVCPPCPKPEKVYIRVPVPMPAECQVCPPCPECQVKAGTITGCIKGCCCNNYHVWDVKLYKRHRGQDTIFSSVEICGCGDFEFSVPFEGCYVLKVRKTSGNCCRSCRCKATVILNNIGVERFMME